MKWFAVLRRGVCPRCDSRRVARPRLGEVLRSCRDCGDLWAGLYTAGRVAAR